jgi:uncharacterized protein YaeQ
VKQPKDFIHHDGTDRPDCWIRNETDDMAYIHHVQYTAPDLRRLAKWCTEAAEYIECMQGDILKSTKTTRIKKA